jgi:ATP-dependent DNA ligase
MLWRVRKPRGRGYTPAAFISPCRPILAKTAPEGPGWAYEVKHDGYRIQLHVRDGRIRLYTLNAADWTDRYPLVVEAAAKLKAPAIIDAELVCTDADGRADFDRLHCRAYDHQAIACAFDVLMHDDEDLRRQPFEVRKRTLRKLLHRSHDAIQYVEHTAGDGAEMFKAACALGLEGIVCKRLAAPYKSGRSRSWLKVKNPRAPAMMRIIDGTF